MSIRVETDGSQRELTRHGSAAFPLVVNHDRLLDFSGHGVRRHWHEDIEIAVVISGSIRIGLKCETRELGVNEGMVINSRVPHEFWPSGGSDPVLHTTIFHPSLIYSTPESVTYRTLMLPYMRSAKLDGIAISGTDIDLMERIDSLFTEHAPGFELRIKALLCSFFADLLCERLELLEQSSAVNDEALARLERILSYMRENCAEPLSLDAVSRLVNLSREGCCRFFKQMTGKTMHEYLEDYRISRAAELLRDPSMSVIEVAGLTGYSNAGRFSASFQRHIGCTPSEYRSAKMHK